MHDKKKTHPVSLKVFGDKLAREFVLICSTVSSLVVSGICLIIEVYSDVKEINYFKVHITGYFIIQSFKQISQGWLLRKITDSALTI